MKIAFSTHNGMVADHNEDAFLISVDPEVCLVMVADGVGGHRAGEVASRLAVGAIQKFLQDRAGDGEGEELDAMLRAAFDHANQEISKQAAQDDSLSGMATTMVLGLFQDGKLYVAHVGDSRAYVVNSRRITPLTSDHSLVAAMVKSGMIAPEEAHTHNLRNIITQCLGCTDYTGPDINVVDPGKGDIFLFCSDGLTDMLADRKINKVVRRNASRLPLCAEKLVAAANKNGGLDNITVVLLSCD